LAAGWVSGSSKKTFCTVATMGTVSPGMTLVASNSGPIIALTVGVAVLTVVLLEQAGIARQADVASKPSTKERHLIVTISMASTSPE